MRVHECATQRQDTVPPGTLSLNPNGRSVLLLHYIPLERTTGDERAEHGAHLLNPPGGTLNRPRRLEGEGAQGAVTFKKKEL